MTEFCVTDEMSGIEGLYYIKNGVAEITERAGASATVNGAEKRCKLTFICPERYADIISAEVADRCAEVITVGYKYDYFNKTIKISGLNETEREILLASVIAADLKEDKKYAFDRLKNLKETALDGVYNFRLKPLKKKWKDIAELMPTAFFGSQLKEFIGFLLENKKKRAYIDDCKVYDNFYRRLKRCTLLGGEDGKIIREVLLSGCGEVEIRGSVPPTDEKYLKEFYGDRVYFTARNIIN